jgi:hypothetical protein
MLVYPKVGCGGSACRLFAHLLVCISQASFEPASGSTGALLFSLCNVVWRSFVQVGGLGVGVLLILGGVFSAKCGSTISARFLIYGAHTLCFVPLIAILNPLPNFFNSVAFKGFLFSIFSSFKKVGLRDGMCENTEKVSYSCYCVGWMILEIYSFNKMTIVSNIIIQDIWQESIFHHTKKDLLSWDRGIPRQQIKENLVYFRSVLYHLTLGGRERLCVIIWLQ